jgi:uncharacterized protein CbrC (UPF0167 family)
MPNKKLHADTYCYARFCVCRVAPFYTKTLSAICAGELGVMSNMNFQYFSDPTNFAYISDELVGCSVCKEETLCFDAGGYSGIESIDYICPDCLKSGKLVELDVEPNMVYGNESESTITIAYKTPALPTWQDTIWPLVNGAHPTFERIASKEDFLNQNDFIESFIGRDQKKSEITWLWDMLPKKRLKNYKEAHDISVYLFSLNHKKYWVWDAN